MTLKARLFDANGADKNVDLGQSTFKLQEDHLLWIDIVRWSGSQSSGRARRGTA